MKRKLWIVLALAVLIAALWCTAGAAEYAFTSFERESPVAFADDDGVYRGHVSWQVNFVPTAIKIYRIDGVAYTTSELVRDLPVTATSTTLEAGYRYNLFIYYGNPDVMTERVYQEFIIAQGSPSITVTQTVFPSIVNPNEKAAFTWSTNFTPTRIEIRNANTEALIATLPGTATGWDQFDRSVVNQIRFYHHDVHVDRTVSIQESGWAFNTQPTGGNIVPDGTLRLSWSTNFTPVKVEIGHKYNTGWPSYEMEYVKDTTITTNLGKSMSHDVPYSFAESSMYIIRAYYNDLYGACVDSVEFSITKTARAFTKQPVGGGIFPGGTLQLQWTTNFTPEKIEIGHKYNTGWPSYEMEYVKDATITTNLGRSMSYGIPYSFAESSMYTVRAYYYKDTYGAYVESIEFNITHSEWAFTRNPASKPIYPWRSGTFFWGTNFVPKKVVLGYTGSSGWVTKATITTGLQKSMSHTFTYQNAVTSDSWAVRAYFGEGAGDFVTSQLFTMTKSAYYTCGSNVTAVYDDGTLTITGTGAMYDYSYESGSTAPWYQERNSITRVVIGEGVTYIGNRAFYNLTNLTTITIPTSLASVGTAAVAVCDALRYVNYDGFKLQWDAIDFGTTNSRLTNAGISYLYRSGRMGNTDVYYLLSGYDNSLSINGSGGSTVHMTPPWSNWAQYITEIRVEGIDTLWEDAFRDCTGVTTVYLDDSLTLIDDGAFCACDVLTDVYYSSTRSDWDDITVNGHNEPLLSADIHTVAHQEQLTGDLSWSVDDAGLLRIWFDDDLMGDGEDTAIPTYSYANSVSTAPWFANYAGAITAIHVESGVTGIGSNAFAGLQQARTVEIADSVTSIGAAAFVDCSVLEDFTLPDSILSIGNGAFRNCTNLEQVFLPDHVTSLGGWVFRGCSNLAKVRLPSQINGIPNQTFYGCTLLEDVDIPVTVTSIGNYAFFSCTGLTRATGHVYYGGTSAQWKEISISATGNGSLQNAANIHMNPEELRVSAANFPDANFRAVVANAFDADQSGWLTDAEIAAVDSFGTEDTDYTTVQGMEFFTEMTFLMLDGAPSLTSIDLSANTKLTHVEVFDNDLTELNLDGLKELRELSCDGNSLTSLDISAFGMKELFCYNNPMTSLTLGSQSDLQRLFCYGTNLDTLDLRGCPLLIDCVLNGTRTVSANYVEYRIDSSHVLRVDAGTELIYPGVIPVDEAHFPDAAFRLWVSDNADRNGSGWLSQDEIDNTEEIYLDVSAYVNLASVQGIAYFTGITELIIEDAPNLTSIDLTANTHMTSLEIRTTGLTALDVSVLPLEYLDCGSNALTGLTLGSQPSLAVLRCCGTDLTELDITGCPYLIEAWLGAKDISQAAYDRYTAGGYILDVDKGLSIITGIPAPTFFLPASLTTLEDEAFAGIAAEAVQIPAGVTVIEGDPFADSHVRYIYGFTELVRTFAGDKGYIFVPVRE